MADIVIDDADTLGRVMAGDNWSRVTAQHYFDGESIYPAFACKDETGDTGEYGTLSVTFQGTSITFHGNTPPAVCSQTISVSIDGNAPYNTPYDDPSPQTILQWYQSPLLTDSLHTISISHIAGTSVDFMVVKAGPTTPLSGERLIVDHDDTAIKYTGKWIRVGGRYITDNDSPHSGLPYGNATHQSNTVGSTATFQFYGTFVSVYSVWDYSLLGAVDVIYKIDSSEYPRTHSVTTDTTQFKDDIRQRENVLLFASEPLPAGAHTLIIEVTSSTNNTAMVLDYILYRPSFDTLATMPELPGISGAARLIPIGTIVGGTLGGIAIFTVLFFIFLRKRIFQRFRQPFVVHAVEPFTATAKTSNAHTNYDPPGKFPQDFMLSTSELTGMSAEQPSAAFRPSNPPQGVLILNSGGGSATITDSTSTARMGQFYGLVARLERAISESGEHSLRVTELKRQIANLMTRDTRHLTVNIPPPYELG